MNAANYYDSSRVYILTLLLGLLASFNAFSQDYFFNTEIINVKDGLPHRMMH